MGTHGKSWYIPTDSDTYGWYGCFLTWSYPESSFIHRWNVHDINHPAFLGYPHSRTDRETLLLSNIVENKPIGKHHERYGETLESTYPNCLKHWWDIFYIWKEHMKDRNLSSTHIHQTYCPKEHIQNWIILRI